MLETDRTGTPRKDARPPFDADHLDGLMDAFGLDVLLATSKHNVQYLLGGYRFFFFDRMDALGHSRYLPILVYPRGGADKAAYFANPMESYEQQLSPLWAPEVRPQFWGTLDAAEAAAAYLKRIGLESARIGIETSFLPADAYGALQKALPNASFLEALGPLEQLRAVKTPTELGFMREASERVVDAMLAVFASHGPGATKRELVSALRREEQFRGLTFEYCLTTVGTSHNRAPSSDATWEVGQPLSLDSGANYEGYIGDLCRMAVLGEPDGELRDLFDEVLAIQDTVMARVKAGALGGDVQQAGVDALRLSPNRANLQFVAHGVGLVSHEDPHLTDRGPVPYPADDAGRPLKSGMVLSVETTLLHPRRGFIKLEDTVAVTDDGFEFFGGAGRLLNRGKL
ncbi:MAG TPA: Xaa-Pro peptidase family protein [Roseiarcus sp.]|jgi:Xaa-Pro aminopeptidase